MHATQDSLRPRAQALLSGESTESQFLAWLHEEIGHSGREDLQDLVDMSDIYTLDGSESAADQWFDQDAGAADARAYVRDAAASIVDGVVVQPRLPPQTLPRRHEGMTTRNAACECVA